MVDKAKLAASTGTVRMTFKTKRPFNPFYVPSSNILVDKKGTLRVYFVSVGDYDANVGAFGPWQTPQWTAPIPEATSALLAKQVKIPAEAIPDNAQVATFVDNDFPRPAADDIYFTKRKVALAPARSRAEAGEPDIPCDAGVRRRPAGGGASASVGCVSAAHEGRTAGCLLVFGDWLESNTHPDSLPPAPSLTGVKKGVTWLSVLRQVRRRG